MLSVGYCTSFALFQERTEFVIRGNFATWNILVRAIVTFLTFTVRLEETRFTADSACPTRHWQVGSSGTVEAFWARKWLVCATWAVGTAFSWTGLDLIFVSSTSGTEAAWRAWQAVLWCL